MPRAISLLFRSDGAGLQNRLIPSNIKVSGGSARLANRVDGDLAPRYGNVGKAILLPCPSSPHQLPKALENRLSKKRHHTTEFFYWLHRSYMRRGANGGSSYLTG